MIALEQVADGPRTVVTLAGGPSGRVVWAEVARHLDGGFAVWSMDRRGKDDSGDTEPYSFEREYEDLQAVAAAFDTDVVFAAHSSGAVCRLGCRRPRPAGACARVLRAALAPRGPAVHDRRARRDGRPDRCGRPAGRPRDRTGELVGLPLPAIDALKPAPGWADRVAHAHTWTREGRELERMPRGTAAQTAIETPTVLLGGDLSPGDLRGATAAVAAALPNATVVELIGSGHGALQTAPHDVADAIAQMIC